MKTQARAQISLELGMAFVCLVLLIVASIRLSGWLIVRMMDRNHAFEQTRVSASEPGGNLGREDDESALTPLKLF
jgi:hypothetical protein